VRQRAANPTEYVTPAEAARIRGVSRPRISALVKAGVFDKFILVTGSYVLLRRQVEEYEPRKAGRPRIATGNSDNDASVEKSKLSVPLKAEIPMELKVERRTKR